jgi:hypothetical protein
MSWVSSLYVNKITEYYKEWNRIAFRSKPLNTIFCLLGKTYEDQEEGGRRSNGNRYCDAYDHCYATAR